MGMKWRTTFFSTPRSSPANISRNALTSGFGMDLLGRCRHPAQRGAVAPRRIGIQSLAVLRIANIRDHIMQSFFCIHALPIATIRPNRPVLKAGIVFAQRLRAICLQLITHDVPSMRVRGNHHMNVIRSNIGDPKVPCANGTVPFDHFMHHGTRCIIQQANGIIQSFCVPTLQQSLRRLLSLAVFPPSRFSPLQMRAVCGLSNEIGKWITTVHTDPLWKAILGHKSIVRYSRHYNVIEKKPASGFRMVELGRCRDGRWEVRAVGLSRTGG